MEITNINVNGQQAPVNTEKFCLVTNPNASFEDYGWDKEFVENMLYVAEYEPDHEWMSDNEILNNLGIVYNDAIGVERNMEKAIYYFEKAVALNNDLARSNLADIYRKGTGGVPVNHAKAFELYKECKLPYAYYRVGEYYENGKAGITDIEKAKQNYRIAYKAKHGLAIRKLSLFNFLED